MNDMESRNDVGYYDHREAMRLLGRYMLTVAILGDDLDAPRDLSQPRRLPRRQATLAARIETADLIR